MKPQNLFLPEELLFKPDGYREITIRRPIECAIIKPETIAQKIDEIANTDITKYSRYSDMLANSISWDTLLPLYLQIFKSYI